MTTRERGGGFAPRRAELENSRRQLTLKRKTRIVWLMPVEKRTLTRQKRSQSGPLKRKRASVAERYMRFFAPVPSPLWQRDDDNFSLEQPSPFKWEPSETTYGIDVNLCLPPNA
jgi:hypothetical protein